MYESIKWKRKKKKEKKKGGKNVQTSDKCLTGKKALVPEPCFRCIAMKINNAEQQQTTRNVNRYEHMKMASQNLYMVLRISCWKQKKKVVSLPSSIMLQSKKNKPNPFSAEPNAKIKFL